jgi:cell division protein FtsW
MTLIHTPRAALRRLEREHVNESPMAPPAKRSRGYVQAFPRGNFNGRALLIVTGLLVTFGTIAVASASEGQSAASGGSQWSIMIHDVIYLGFGIIALYAMTRIRIDQLVRKAPLLMMGGLGLLIAVKAVGLTANGGKRWLNLRVIDLQPSEMFKLFTVLFVAWLVEQHHEELNNWMQLAMWTLPVSVGCGLILIEPDIGTMSVVAIIAFVMLGVAGLSGRLMAMIVSLGLVGFYGYMKFNPYSYARFFSFLHPNSDLQGTGYQLLQSKIGLGAGGLSGLGLGHSREKWGLLPNPHTDFIFTIIGEELGIIGTILVIALFVAFLFAAVRIAQKCTNDVYRIIAMGIATWITLEAIINIASVVGWWAVTGIPLPFFSYGGTALITELAAVGLLYNIAHDQSRSHDVSLREYVRADFRASMERRAPARPGPSSRPRSVPPARAPRRR